jgi:hypothetical protein
VPVRALALALCIPRTARYVHVAAWCNMCGSTDVDLQWLSSDESSDEGSSSEEESSDDDRDRIKLSSDEVCICVFCTGVPPRLIPRFREHDMQDESDGGRGSGSGAGAGAGAGGEVSDTEGGAAPDDRGSVGAGKRRYVPVQRALPWCWHGRTASVSVAAPSLPSPTSTNPQRTR